MLHHVPCSAPKRLLTANQQCPCIPFLMPKIFIFFTTFTKHFFVSWTLFSKGFLLPVVSKVSQHLENNSLFFCQLLSLHWGNVWHCSHILTYRRHIQKDSLCQHLLLVPPPPCSFPMSSSSPSYVKHNPASRGDLIPLRHCWGCARFAPFYMLKLVSLLKDNF